MDSVIIKKSDKPAKKLVAIFKNKKTKKEKKVYFGSATNKDYTIYSKDDKAKAEKMKKSYIARHKVREDWTNPQSAGALSRYILWNLPTLASSIKDYRKKFGY